MDEYDKLKARTAALNAAIEHLKLVSGYESAVKVVAFAQHFEHYITTGENKKEEEE